MMDAVEGRPSFAELVLAYATVVRADGPPTEGELGRAREVLVDMGVRRLFDDLAMAERIILAGEGFHSVERFFVEGSAEQRFVIDLVQRSRDLPG